MRLIPSAALTLIATLIHMSASAQTGDPSEILAEAERVYPESKAPALFAPGSGSAPYAVEPEDEIWAPETESRILAELQQERDQGLIIKRAEVECRSSTCALLLIHVANRAEGSVDDLADALRRNLRFAGVSQTSTRIPMQERTGDGRRTTWFMLGYVEIVLTGAFKTPQAARQ